MKILFHTILLCLAIGVKAQKPEDMFYTVNVEQNGKTFKIDPKAIGFINLDGKVFAGTGFVLNNKRQVVTCAHVIDTNHVMYYYSSNPRLNENFTISKLKIKKYLPQYDLALLESETDLCYAPLVIESTISEYHIPLNRILYFGYNPTLSSDTLKQMQVGLATISSVGKTTLGNGLVDFIEFIGDGIPGFSGGPVINFQGKIIGVMREAWRRQPIKPGPPDLMNRAFSIEPLSRK